MIILSNDVSSPNEVNGLPAAPVPGPNYIEPVRLFLDILRDAGFIYGYYGGTLPIHYDPTGKPAAVVTVKGGSTHSEFLLQKFAIQVACWAGVNEFVLSRKASFLVAAAAHGINNKNGGQYGVTVACVETAPGQEVVDPDSGWSTTISTFELLARSN